nr:putative diphthamide biosynthesis protein 1 [Cucujiformia]
YGACCVDDFTARSLNVDLIIHYGHSCLVPMDPMNGIKTLYVFVDIKIDPLHFIDTIQMNFLISKRLCLVSTIQFLSTLHGVAAKLREHGYKVTLPQSHPLSGGEILGCTAPILKDVDAIIYLGDGRFHLEAIMIANPEIEGYRYDPYKKEFTREYYEYDAMNFFRKQAIERCRNAKKFGVIMGTLGRQGNPKVVEYLRSRLRKNNREEVVILLSEIFPKKLDLFGSLDAFVQIACPRLSIDWGTA